MQFIEREQTILMGFRGETHILQIFDAHKQRISQSAMRIDLVLEFCSFDLQKIISNGHVRFQLAEVKTILREILIGLNAMHEKKVIR